MRVEGRAWLFGDDISTDLIYPQTSYRLGSADAAAALFASLRPGWAARVRPGDVIVAGRNFGRGSARPAPVLLRALGVGACVADSLAALFLRNCVNAGLPALACPGVRGIVGEGDVVAIDLRAGTVENRRTAELRSAPGLPPELLDIIESGGLLRQLEARGLVAGAPDDRKE